MFKKNNQASLGAGRRVWSPWLSEMKVFVEGSSLCKNLKFNTYLGFSPFCHGLLSSV